MLDLCRTPDPQPSLQLSQSLYTSQTVVQSLAARMRRSHSVASSSLFSSPPGSYSGPVESTSKPISEEGVVSKKTLMSTGEAAGTEILDTSIHSPASTLTSDDRQFDDKMVDLSNSVEALKGQVDDARMFTAERDTEVLVGEASQPSDIESGFQLSLDVSPTEEQKQLVGIMGPRSPLSPAGEDVESRYGKEPDPLDSQFDIIPCAQVLSTSKEDEKSFSPREASNGLHSEMCLDIDSVQLEYDMSDLSLLEASENPLVSALESPSAPATSILGPDAFVLSQFGNIIPPAQIPMSQRRKLLHLCSGEERKGEGEGTASSGSEEEEEEEEESYWLSQEVWEDVGSPQQQRCVAHSDVMFHVMVCPILLSPKCQHLGHSISICYQQPLDPDTEAFANVESL